MSDGPDAANGSKFIWFWRQPKMANSPAMTQMRRIRDSPSGASNDEEG
jgi:hypothetical protein